MQLSGELGILVALLLGQIAPPAPPTRHYVYYIGGLPARCNPSDGDIVLLIGTGPYWCSATDTWTAVGGGGGGTPGGSDTQLQINNAGAFGGIPVTYASNQLYLNAGHKLKRTATATDYTVLTSDYYVGVTDTSAARTITLPDLTTTDAGFEVTVADESNGALTNNISIITGGADTFITGITSPVRIDVSLGVATIFWTGTSATCCWRIK